MSDRKRSRKFARRKTHAEHKGLVFAGSITPHDQTTGALITAAHGIPAALKPARAALMFFDVPEANAMVQTWAIYKRLAQLLEESGASLRQIVRQRLFIRDVRDLPAIERVMDLALEGWRPTTTIVVMPNGSIHDNLHVQLDAIAAVDRDSIRVIEGPRGRYPAAIQVGRLLFTSSVSGVGGEPAGVGTVRDGRAEDVRLLRTQKEHRIYEQGLRTFENLQQVLKLAGATIADILKVNGWVDLPMREYGAVVLARRQFFDATERNMMASTGLAVGGCSEPGALLSFDAIALLPEANAPGKQVTGLASPIASPYVAGAAKGGGFIFTSGEIPVVMPQGDVVTACDKLPDEGRFMRFGHIEPESGMEARAWYVYKTLEAYLEKLDASLDQVVHQTVFIEDARQFPVLERVATMYFGACLPPTTVVPISDTTPFRSAELEIDFVAACDAV